MFRIGRTLPLLLLFGIAALPVAAMPQQAGGSWSDGNPQFTRFDSTFAVRVDSAVGLVSTLTVAQEPDTFLLHLSGNDRVYTNATAAEDFSQLPDIDLYLITDSFTRRVFVIRPQDGLELAEFKGLPNTPEALSGPVAARAFIHNGARKVLVTDQASHRVLLFDYDTRVLEWVYGTGIQGSGAGQLSAPSAAAAVPDSSQVLICDTGNDRILLVEFPSSQVRWEWGPGVLDEPVDVELTNGAVLVTDRGNHRVVIVDRTTSTIQWQFGTGTAGQSDTELDTPEDAQVLPSGDILIADGGNDRLMQVDINGTITWRFLGDLEDLEAAYRLADGRTLVVSENQPRRLGYSDESFISQPHDLGREASYDSISWRAVLPPGTSLRFQLRTSANLGDLDSSPWLGPQGAGSYYTADSITINPVHNGHRFYQYRVELRTTDPLLSPELSEVAVHYHFFDTESRGVFTSEVISDSAGLIITGWQELRFNTVIPDDPALRDDIQIEVSILDTLDAVLQSYLASNSNPENIFDISKVERLRNVQAVRLRALLLTNNDAVSPALDDWSITWENTPTSDAAIEFTDSEGSSIDIIRTQTAAQAGAAPKRNVFITLRDQSLIPIQDGIDVVLQSRKSGDAETVTLQRQPTGAYILSPGLPAVISDFVGQNNQFIELSDRDTLTVRYQDPATPSDVATDSIVVLQLTSGQLAVEDPTGPISDTTLVAFGDTLSLWIAGEFDRDLSPAQDTIFASFLDNVTDDVEDVILLEVANDVGDTVFTTGEFRSSGGVVVVEGAVGSLNDGRLQTLYSNEIAARYVDNDTLTVILRMEPEPPDTTTPPPEPITGPGAFQFLLAPNPYRVNNGAPMRMRMEAYTGGLALQKVEIYNIAGERVRTIEGGILNMDSGTAISKGTRSTTQDQWWDLTTDGNASISSGTYWAKFYGRFTDDTGQTEDVTYIRKFVIVR